MTRNKGTAPLAAGKPAWKEETGVQADATPPDIQLLSRLAEETAKTTDLRALYTLVIDELVKQFGYYHVQLFRYDAGSQSLKLVMGHGEIGKQMLADRYEVSLGSGLIGLAAATGMSLLRSRLEDEQSWLPHPMLPHTRGQLSAPITLGHDLMGVLDVQSDEVDRLTANDQQLVEAIATQLAVAVETSRLRTEATERLRELHSLQRLVSRDGWRNLQAGHRLENRAFLFDQTDVTDVPVTELANAKGEQAEAEVATIPLQVRGEVIGIFGVETSADDPLLPEERALLEAVAIQVAEALENARLLEQTQKRAVELETVSQVAVATSSLLNSERLLQAVVDLTKQSFNLYHAHIYLLDEEHDQLILVAGSGPVGEIMRKQGWRIHMDQASLVARAANSRSGVIVNDVRKESGFLPNPLLPSARAELAVPMIVGNRLLGVLDVQSDQTGYFTEEDVRIQMALATQVAVALQNAMRYEEQLHTAEKLREVERLKSEFLASMSHELRTPLNSIIGFADVLLEGIDGELNERMTEDIELIRESGQYLRELIGDILDMSKIEAGKMKLRYEIVDLPAVVDEIMANAQKVARSYGKEHLRLEAELAPDVQTVYADRTRLKQVLYNLLSNAIKFTEKGSVRLGLEYDEEWLLARVIDSGIGIRPEHKPLVFEQFRQVDSSLSSTGGGTGLGLPISKRLIELHDGEIWFDSEVEKGSTFWFKIPRNGPRYRLPQTGPLQS